MATGVVQGVALTGMGVVSILNSAGAVTVALGGTVLVIHPAVAITYGVAFIVGGGIEWLLFVETRDRANEGASSAQKAE